MIPYSTRCRHLHHLPCYRGSYYGCRMRRLGHLYSGMYRFPETSHSPIGSTGSTGDTVVLLRMISLHSPGRSLLPPHCCPRLQPHCTKPLSPSGSSCPLGIFILFRSSVYEGLWGSSSDRDEWRPKTGRLEVSTLHYSHTKIFVI